MIGLAVCGAAGARKIRVCPREGWREPVNVYVLVALPPGTRKSQVFAAATRPVAEWEAAEVERLLPEISAAKSRRDILQERLKATQQNAARAKPEDQETLTRQAGELAAQLAATPLPVLPQLLADDVTTEKVSNLLFENRERLAVMSAEGGLFDTMAGRYSANGQPNFEIYLKAHAGDPHRVGRMGRPPEFLKEPALTLVLTVQPEVLNGLGRHPVFRGRGLLGRFLYANPPSPLGHRAIDAPPVTDATRCAYHRHVEDLLHLPWNTPAAGRYDAHDLTLTAEALKTLRAFEARLEPQLAEFGELGDMGDWGGKLAGTVLRIAGILHLADHAGQPGPWQTPIPASTVERAVQIAEYLVPHARAAFEQMGADPVTAGARHVLHWLTDRWEPGRPVSTRDIHQGVKGRYPKVADLAPFVAVLVEHGHLRARPETPRPADDAGRRRPGRPASPTYDVNPHAFPRRDPIGSISSQSSKPSPAPPAPGDSEDSEDFELRDPGAEVGAGSPNAMTTADAPTWDGDEA
jgi:Protein of unknown function (DUF3987)